ncbi:uncharacterized protein LOC123525928 [Mercenaria mercenaria]|uniref:uncharacterized protein LOC123525928 n=1 Tax=Mercenaria mercenaria TaxID=6596 RepID=UPI00234F2219|nr:uncharacterized protein LOC123525928 [Mercenaria mercenaria]
MAAPAAMDSVTEEEIDQLTMPKAMKLCRTHQIKLGDNKDLDKIKWLLKYELLCKGKKREEAMGFLSTSGDHDKTRREALSVLYDNTIAYAQSIQDVKDQVVEELSKMFPNVCESLNHERQKMLSDVAPVLVLGETGSGKSSFINLLLGQNILPCSLLSNTHVICEIQYSGDGQKSRAELHKAGSSKECTVIEDIGDGKFTEVLAKHIQQLDSNKRAVYRLANIYLPCDILKSGLMIVDSPGIGETKEMTSMVLSYILNASAFIYIIDSTNAGGMQARVKELVQKVYRQALEEQRICRPESAIFVCNKWDEVCSRDRADVWEDTKRKVKDAWPECKESQIIRFSTVEASFIQDKGGMAPKFETILKNINTLIPVGQEVLVLKGYRYIEHFISRCIVCFGAHLSQLNLSKEEREQKRTDAKDRLNQLKSRITTFFDEQSKRLKAEIENIADDLKKYINEKPNLDRVCKFSDKDLPKRQNWNEAAVEVRHKVYGSMRTLIKDWESQETHFGKLAKHIEDSIEKEFPAFDKEIYQAEKLLSNSQKTTSVDTDETEIGLVPEFIQNRIGGLSLGTKVALGIGLSPVLLVGMIFRLPVLGAQAFEKFYSKYSLEKEFREAAVDNGDKEKLKYVCEKYARKTVESITDKMNMRQVIEEDMQPLTTYLKQQQKRMEMQIQCDLDLLKNLKDEDRKDEDVLRVYDPLNAKFLILRECLQHFMLIHLPAKFASWIEEVPFADIEVGDTLICSGMAADIFQARSKPSTMTDGKDIVCVRVIKEKIKENKMKQFLKILEAYKTIKKKNIAKCYGFWNPGVGSGKLYQILEPLQCSLRQFAAGADFQHNHDNNCVRTMTQLMNGLNFLHDRKLVHFDLSMDTVAVDENGKVKLTNISPEMRLNLEPEVIDGKVCLSKYIHIEPKFFQNKNRVVYRIRDDMYGVGIIMWELWVGQPVVEIGKEFEIPKSLKRRSSATSTSSQLSRNSKGGSSKSSNSELEKSGSTGSFKGRKGSSKKKKSQESGKGEESDTDDVFEWVEDEVWFSKYLETFRPVQTDDFHDENKKRAQLSEKWWQTVEVCLHQNINAKEWLELWKDYPNFPELSIVFQEKHFSNDTDK